MTDSAPIHVEVLYALSGRAELVALELPAGSTLEQAITASGLLEKYPEIQLGQTH
ncbi:MAG: RnfH family protein, partial [Rhodocyclaceae bacterium]|nr:RnfH family protein [Rhodocyclaceae bacterium]